LDGSQGPVGPAGPSGAAVRAEHSWSIAFTFSNNSEWVAIPASTVPFVSEGGPLVINVDLSVFAAVTQTFSCRPMVDGMWAGQYGGYPYSAKWTEGLNGSTYGWSQWSKSRLYRGIPAGQHTLTVECLKDSDVNSMIGHDIVPQSVSVLEMH
jgi:hypothetical protein